jgi:hypothetical protein
MADDVGGRITKLNSPTLGLTKYINVFGRVGPNEQNQEVDVRVVAALLAMSVAGRVRGVGPPRNIRASQFDATVGFWIFLFQFEQHKRRGGAIIDGVVSPGSASGSYGGGFHTILLLNAEARKQKQGIYDAVIDGKLALTQVD